MSPLTSPPESKRARAIVLGILTPYTGGFYYGSILKGVHNTARSSGASTFAMQTTSLDVMGSGSDKEVLTLNAADGWVVINEAVQHPFCERLLASGVPLVGVNAERDDYPMSSVLPDNEQGMKTAVQHLIEHGHERIVFFGNCTQFDIKERYQGYRLAMKEAGLVPREEWGFGSRHNLESDGKELGRAILASSFEFTAAVAATDKLAIGVLEELTTAGVRIPESLALVGFDDIEKAQYTEPALTTVRQNFASLGVRAANELLAHLLDGLPLGRCVRAEVPFIPRRSCGCSVSLMAPAPRPRGRAHRDAEWLHTSLLKLAGEPRGIPLKPKEWPQAKQIALRMDAAVKLTPWVRAPDDSWQSTWEIFGRYNRSAESIHRALSLLESFAQEQDLDDDAKKRAARVITDLRAALLLSWQRAEQYKTRQYESVAETMARISNFIARADSGLDLGWLQLTDCSYGTLGLWMAIDAGRRLQITHEYLPAGLVAPGEKRVFEPAIFPPSGLVREVNERASDQILIIVPLSGSDKDHGILAVGATVDAELLDHVVHIGDWGAQIGSALDQARVALQFRNHALHDALTGLPNRAALLEHLSELSQQEGIPSFAVLFLDLDDFKKVNDSLGHHAGDALLIQVAARLRKAIGEENFVARLGGDEFVMVLHHCPDEPMAERMVDNVLGQLKLPVHLDGNTAFVSGSIGVAFGQSRGGAVADLLRDADTAMYRAKVHGRSQHAVFHRSMHEQAVERLKLEEQLRRALDEDQFELEFQPIVALGSGLAVGAEALIRWNHPTQGHILPSRFIAVAGDVGLILPLSDWVMRRACKEAASWQAEGSRAYVSVNVPAEQLKDESFVERVAALLTETGLKASGLSVEILENSLVEQLDVASATLSKLRSLGVRVSLDDFGTGYSSLNYLKQLPVDVLKLDRSFVSHVPESSQDAAIISAVLTMGRGLGLPVVAEGVETGAQLEFLSEQGCTLVQGYYFSPPLPAEKWRELLASGARLIPAETSYPSVHPPSVLPPDVLP